MWQGGARLSVRSHEVGQRDALPAARHRHAGRPAARPRHRDAGSSTARSATLGHAARRAQRVPARHRGHLLDGQPVAQHLRRGRHGARGRCPTPCWRPAARCPPSFPGASPSTSTSSFGARPTSAFRASAATSSRAASRPTHWRACRWPPTTACSSPTTACASTTRARTTTRPSSSRSRGPTAATSTTPPTRACGGAPAAPRSPRSWPRWAVRSPATSAQSRSSATSCGAAASTAVFAEIDEIAALGYDGLWIADDTFTLDSPYLEGVLPAHGGPRRHLDCLSRARGIRRRHRAPHARRPAAGASTWASSRAARRRSPS